MSTSEELQAEKAPPAWFDKVDWDALANSLNQLLQERLKEGLPSELGAEIAAEMGVSQIDVYDPATYDGRQPEPSGDALGKIAKELTEELQRRLIEEYGVPPEEAQLAVVSESHLMLNYALSPVMVPICEWEHCWDYIRQKWCVWWDCCPCT